MVSRDLDKRSRGHLGWGKKPDTSVLKSPVERVFREASCFVVKSAGRGGDWDVMSVSGEDVIGGSTEVN
jgi:hypothetical protein